MGVPPPLSLPLSRSLSPAFSLPLSLARSASLPLSHALPLSLSRSRPLSVTLPANQIQSDLISFECATSNALM